MGIILVWSQKDEINHIIYCNNSALIFIWFLKNIFVSLYPYMMVLVFRYITWIYSHYFSIAQYFAIVLRKELQFGLINKIQNKWQQCFLWEFVKGLAL